MRTELEALAREFRERGHDYREQNQDHLVTPAEKAVVCEDIDRQLRAVLDSHETGCPEGTDDGGSASGLVRRLKDLTVTLSNKAVEAIADRPGNDPLAAERSAAFMETRELLFAVLANEPTAQSAPFYPADHGPDFPAPTPCPDCKGEREINTPTAFWRPCPTCSGSGEDEGKADSLGKSRESLIQDLSEGSISRYVTVMLDNAIGERFDFRVLIDGDEYAKGNCASRERAIQQAQHYAFMELSR